MSSSVWGPGERRGKREVPLRRHWVLPHRLKDPCHGWGRPVALEWGWACAISLCKSPLELSFVQRGLFYPW
jgi:hypothetical protein